MATKRRIIDPAEVQNRRVLEARDERILQNAADSSMDLGLDIQEPAAENAADLLRDEWDKKYFGNAPKTTTRTVYGPDPIVNRCPEFHERLEKMGKEPVADAFMQLVLERGELAAPDPIMRKGLRASIQKFGKEATARAFYDRIMAIPHREVEIELDEVDPLLADPMRDAVARYSRPGMAVKFLSDAVNRIQGMRGYKPIIDERGDVVKVGTLIMAELPQEMADRRRKHWAEESRAQMAEQGEAFYEQAKRDIRDARVDGIAPLEPGDMVQSNPDLNDEWLNEKRRTGVSFERG